MANAEQKIGSVLVVGAGIAGMQAALDCANAGFKVYLLEEKPAIGGNMARLDKTFPTNDCAMCMISPKLVETGRHLNIEIISYADLKKVEGEAGNFTVTVRKRARYVDESKCNGCGDCERACPVSIKDSFNGDLAQRKAIYRLYPQAIPNVFTIDKQPAPPPCRGTCPAGVNAQGYIALIAKGDYLRALDVVRERMPFAGSCGRVCHHPCESKCNRAQIDEPVAVRNLKRFVADHERDLLRRGQSVERPPTEEVKPERQNYAERVAIIGGGPAGLTCAGDLARLGYPVTVFDANAKLGGMLRTGIPEYRLPKDFLDHEIGLVIGEGVEVRAGQALGRDFTLDDLTAQGFQSVFLATGAQLARRIPLAGSEARGVLYGIDFLREVNETGRAALGKEIVVVGGGNVAMDVARAALRASGGGNVSVYCLESRAEMPAHAWEIQEAEEEGIAIHPSWGPARVVSENGGVSGIDFTRCTSVFDADRRFSPQFNPDETRFAKADTVILAIGQACDLSFADHAQLATERGLIKTDRLTLSTSLPGVFAGGDVVLGPASLVAAVEQGHRGAESIHRFLRGAALDANREPVARPTELAPLPDSADCSCIPRVPLAQARPAERSRSFIEIDSGYTAEMAQAEARRCLQCGGCSVCRECVRVCKARAIDHQMLAYDRQLQVGAVIMTGGYDTYDAGRKSEYGFGRFPNVVTSIQFERILSASGPYQGHLQRPSDGRTPRKIAWIQCVGSRDVTTGNDYCSSVCCMVSTKSAIIAKEHEAIVEPTIFFIDMRAFGKGFEGFYNRAKDNYGVRYVRSQVSTVKEDPANQNLVIRYVGEGSKVVEEEFDMVVLSVGLVRHHALGAAAAAAGVACERHGFAQGRPLAPLVSSRAGVFLSGAVSGPKDIPETVMESSAAAALVGELLASVRGTQVKIKEYPTECATSGEPRIGVFICHCGTNIASVVSVTDVADYARQLPGVVYAEHTIYTCSQDTQERIKGIIREQGLNRVIVASCTPRTHQPLFQETLREAGLNKYMFEMADIREQCSWVHQREHAKATTKAMDLVRGSVGKSAALEPLQFKKVGITKSALVIGGGIAGMSAALSLAAQGFAAHLVEKSDRLGGNLWHLKRTLEGHDLRTYLIDTIARVEADPKITVYLGSEIDETSGFVGNFTTRLKGASRDEISHGVIVVATGAAQWQPTLYGYGARPNVVTQRDLEAHIGEPGFAPRSVVMIQCVGSRDKERPYCSRVCCAAAVKNALVLKAADPAAQVTVLYRDIRTYQFKEEYYRQAREAGVRFIHFPDDEYPEVRETANGLEVSVRDTVLGETLRLPADLLVLSAATVPDLVGNRRLSELLKIPLSEDGFFMEAHIKLRPVDFATEGIFVCGLAHSPKATEENVTQALAAAGRAATILSRDSLEVGGAISVVAQEKCATCLTCVRECVYNAPFVNGDGKAEIEAAKCQGCGNCASACPAQAIQLRTFTDVQERALFHAILKKDETMTPMKV